MNLRTTLSAVVAAVALITASGCAVTRGQSTAGEYVDDAAITTKVKARFVENKQVDASAISVQTLNGEVLLSGFAKSSLEKTSAGQLAMGVSGVKQVKNDILVRP